MTSGVNSVVPMACTGNACAFKSTCFVGDTPIQMYDGSTKRLKTLNVGIEYIHSIQRREDRRRQNPRPFIQ